MPDVEAVASMLEARVLPSDASKYRPRYNAAPSDEHFIVLQSPQGRVLVPAVWGLQGGVINARAETADRRFKAAFLGRRVIVPADGFFEWTGPRDQRRPLWFRPRNGGLLYLAGLAEERASPATGGARKRGASKEERASPATGGARKRGASNKELPDGRLAFVILTTDASGAVARVHDRMPVILPKESVSLWLSKPDSGLLVPAPDDFLTATEVSRRVNDVKNDDPTVLEPVQTVEQEQLRLF